MGRNFGLMVMGLGPATRGDLTFIPFAMVICGNYIYIGQTWGKAQPPFHIPKDDVSCFWSVFEHHSESLESLRLSGILLSVNSVECSPTFNFSCGS